ncbi:MAG: hypothetical protein BGP11_12710 [Rhodobacterales bacterium 65-51]|uniref:glycoside hydrolase family protein n=1 Tax=uncultured Gemmobacter sp. TaxID=1095917 RepID=UPI00095D0C5D|nr:hypothetical protein [uncultured Gemmobacter sp.]OJY33927.1 MAG: hypothetical protein BGP11_12710 [Rhodobacterales bacterium 65-51]
MNDMTPDLAMNIGINMATLAKQLAKLEKDTVDMVRGIEKKAQIRIGTNSAAKSAEIFEAELERMRNKFDPLYAASKRYEAQLDDLNLAHRMGVLNAKQYEQALERLAQQYLVADNAAGRAARGQYDLGRISAQAGLQVQDTFVQWAAGTSIIQALSQQAPQLLGLFGAWGAWAGAAVAIGLPAIAMLAKMSGETKSLTDLTEELEQATGAQADAATAARSSIEDLRATYGDMADEIQRALELQLKLTAAQGEAALLSAAKAGGKLFSGGFLSPPTEMFSGSDRSQRTYFNAGDEAAAQQQMRLKQLMTDTGATVDQAERLQRALRMLETSNGPEAALRDAERLREILIEIAGGIPQALQKFGEEFTFLGSVVAQAQRQIELGMSDTERRGAELAEAYDRRTRDLARLATDRADAEKQLALAREKGDETAIASAERMIGTIDDEIARTRDVKARVEDVGEEMKRVRDLAGKAALNPEFEAQYTALQKEVERARREGEKLGEVDLSRLETAVRKLMEMAGLMADGFARVGEGLSSGVADAYRQYGASRRAGEWIASSDAMSAARGLISAKEGYRSEAYWDVNHWRAGYGSDTGTRADGSTYSIQKGMVISADDAQRDLDRRIQSYFDTLIGQIGQTTFEALSAAQKAALASLLHNYGEGELKAGGDLGGVLSALRDGNSQGVADAIAARASDNAGINRSRRLEEAQAFGGASGAMEAQLSAEQKALQEQVKAREDLTRAHDRFSESLLKGIADAEFERSILGKSKEDQARLRAEYLLTAQAKRDGLDLNARLAGSEMTVAEAIQAKAQADAEAALAAEKRRVSEELATQRLRQAAQAQKQFADQLVDSIVAGRGLDSVLANLAATLAKSAVQNFLFGSVQNGVSSGGVLSGLFNGIGKLFSFEGGGETPSGARSGGLDGRGGFLAMLHPDETVIDHVAGRSRVPSAVASPASPAISGGAGRQAVSLQVIPSPYFDVRVGAISNGVSVQHQREAQRAMPYTMREMQARGTV